MESLDEPLEENRIQNLEEIQDIKDLVLCGICFMVVTEDRKPVQCETCQNSLFCSQCI